MVIHASETFQLQAFGLCMSDHTIPTNPIVNSPAAEVKSTSNQTTPGKKAIHTSEANRGSALDLT